MIFITSIKSHSKGLWNCNRYLISSRGEGGEAAAEVCENVEVCAEQWSHIVGSLKCSAADVCFRLVQQPARPALKRGRQTE